MAFPLPILSIITINKNNIHGLQGTILSVQSLDLLPIEHIIIDGCSSDGSDKLIDSYLLAQNGYHVISISEADLGIYDAWNKGILLARSLHCLFLNSGDELDPNFTYSKLLSLLSDTTSVSLFLLPVSILKANHLAVKRQVPVSLFSLFITNTIHHQGAIYSTSVLKLLGGYHSSFPFIGCDYHLNIRYLLHLNRLKLTPTVLKFYNSFSVMEPGGISISNPLKVFSIQHQVRCSIFSSHTTLKIFSFGIYILVKYLYLLKSFLVRPFLKA